MENTNGISFIEDIISEPLYTCSSSYAESTWPDSWPDSVHHQSWHDAWRDSH